MSDDVLAHLAANDVHPVILRLLRLFGRATLRKYREGCFKIVVSARKDDVSAGARADGTEYLLSFDGSRLLICVGPSPDVQHDRDWETRAIEIPFENLTFDEEVDAMNMMLAVAPD